MTSPPPKKPSPLGPILGGISSAISITNAVGGEDYIKNTFFPQ